MSGRCYPDSDRIRHFKVDADFRELDGEHRYVEVRYDDEQQSTDPDAWTVDEICTTQVHLEAMDQDAVWMEVCGLHVWFRAVRVKGDRRPHLIVTCFPDAATPYVVRPGEGTLEYIGRQLQTMGDVARALAEDLEPAGFSIPEADRRGAIRPVPGGRFMIADRARRTP
jgi:hypothetical protein